MVKRISLFDVKALEDEGRGYNERTIGLRFDGLMSIVKSYLHKIWTFTFMAE